MYILLVPVIPSLFCTIVILFMAESPRFLLLDKQSEKEAKKGEYQNITLTTLKYDLQDIVNRPVSRSRNHIAFVK